MPGSQTRCRNAATASPAGFEAEKHGDPAAALEGAARVVDATYDAPLLVHGQLEPPTTIARWNEDGTLDLWLPNEMPDVFQQVAANVAGIAQENVRIHSPMLGGFFGRHFLYNRANPFPQAIFLTKAVGRPVKLIWSREEEFLRDAMRMLGHRMPGPTEDYAEFEPDYRIASRGAIDAYFAELGPEFVLKSTSEAICGHLRASGHIRPNGLLQKRPIFQRLGWWA